MVTARQQEVMREIRRLATAALGQARQVAPDDDLGEALELDSLTRVSLIVAIEDRFRVALPDDELVRVRTLAELSRLVARLSPEALRMTGAPPPPLRFATLNEALATAARADETYRFVDAGEREALLPHALLHTRARRVAAALAAAGVAPGDRVALVLATGPEFFVAFFGVLAAGAVPVPLYPPVRLGRLDEYHAGTARMLERAGACLVVTERRVLRILGETVARARPRLGVRRVDELEAAARGEHEATVAERRARAHPVLLGHDGRAQAGRAHPRQRARPVRRAARAHAAHGDVASARRRLAAALPRHGAHRRAARRRTTRAR